MDEPMMKLRLEIHLAEEAWTDELSKAFALLVEATSSSRPARYSIKRGALYNEPFGEWPEQVK